MQSIAMKYKAIHRKNTKEAGRWGPSLHAPEQISRTMQDEKPISVACLLY